MCRVNMQHSFLHLPSKEIVSPAGYQNFSQMPCRDEVLKKKITVAKEKLVKELRLSSIPWCHPEAKLQQMYWNEKVHQYIQLGFVFI